MNSRVLKLLVCVVLFFTFTPNTQVFAYADLTNFNTYIDNLDISYEDLSLTPKELSAIEELRQNGGITYAMHENDNTIYMIYQQISEVFDIDATPVIYDDYAILLNDVATGKVDFTGSMLPTKERLALFDFTTSTHKDKTFLFIKHDDYDLINSKEINRSRVLRVGYPTGFALDGLLSDNFKQSFEYELTEIRSIDEAVKLIKDNKIDMVFSDISWYGELVALENYMGIDYTEYIDNYFSGNLTKKGTNKELISAINKMYAETDALVELQDQIDNYYEDATIYALIDKYYDIINHNKTHKIYISEYRPYVYKENGAYTGLFIDLLGKIFDRFDVNYEFVLNNDLNYNYLPENEIAVTLPVFITDETREKYNLTIPITESNMTVITKPDNFSESFTQVKDLEIQKVGAVGNSYMYDYLEEVFINPENVTYYTSLKELVSAIESGEVKFGIVPYEEFNKYAIEEQITHISVMDSLELPKYSIALATPKTEQGLQYESILSSVISIMNYSDLEDKYLSTRPEMETVYENKNEVLASTIHMIIFTGLFAIAFLCALININQKRANTDYLTKLRNRRTLDVYIKSIKSKKNMSIAYIDLDNFKLINDVYGHHYGDRVIVYVANELLKLSKYSRSFRVGGDEFIIIYNNEQLNFHEKIKTILDKTIKIEQTDIKVEGSIGNLNLETYSDFDVEDLINLVDYAMISAKRSGKNVVVEITDDLVTNYVTIRDLRNALEKEQYEDSVKFYLESIKDNDTINGFCLVAKCHHDNHFINYNELRIHMSNKLVLSKIGLLIFEKLCITINQVNENTKVKMKYIYELETGSVNEQTILSLAIILAEYNIKPSDITLRIDPNIFNGSKGVYYVELLNKLGCKISIDFYKINGESLLYLNYLDFSLVELDLSGLLEFLKNKYPEDPNAVFTEFSSNLALEKIIEICNAFNTDLLLYTFDNDYMSLVINHLKEQLSMKIYIIEKENLTLLDEYLANFK